MKYWSLCLSASLSLVALPAFGQTSNDDNGRLLAACVETAKKEHPGPDFTDRYKAIDNCNVQYPYEYQPSTTTVSAPPETDYGRMRQVAEEFVRQRLIDPSSAQFEWPHGFMSGTWKPLLRKRVSGYVTCGYVNAKNRLGGYVGRSGFVVVLNNYHVDFGQVGDGGDYDLVTASCQKSASSFPPPQAGMLNDSASEGVASSVADQLEKLVNLLDRGFITRAEFDAQKQKLLNQ